MQQIKLHKNYKYASGIDETEYSPIVYERKEKLEKYEKLRQEGCFEETIFEEFLYIYFLILMLF